MANSKRYLHASVLALGLALAADARAADPEERARAHYDRAVELFSEGNYPAALVELQRAGELRPSYKLFHSMAQVHAAMNDAVAAIEAYRKYLQQGGQRVSAERRREVSDEIATLTRRVASFTITADVSGAEVWVDDARVGTTPLRSPLLLNAGPHRISVRHADFPERSRRVAAVGGDTERLEFVLRPDAARQVSPEPPAPAPAAAEPRGAGFGAAESYSADTSPAADDASLRKYAWVGWVATGVFAAGATATGFWALSSNSNLDEDRDSANTPGGPTRGDLQSSASDVRALATVTDVLWVAAAAAGGVSLWLTFGGSDAEDPPASAARPLRLLVSGSGASLQGSF